jgi:hypothetical protein
VTDIGGTSRYRTNRAGDGVWVEVERMCACLNCQTPERWAEFKQILGTAQFSLDGVSAATRRRRVVRRFAVS